MSVTKLDVLLLTVGEVEFAVPVSGVREVVRAAALSAVADPGVRLEGLLNLRGRAVPVASLGIELGLSPTELSTTDQLVVVESERGIAAIRSNRAADLVSVERLDGEQRADPRTGSANAFVRETVRTEERLVGLLDVDRVVAFAIDAPEGDVG